MWTGVLLAEARGQQLVMTYKKTTSEATEIESEFKSDLASLKKYLTWIDNDVARFNSSVPETALQGIKSRREKILKDRNLVAKIGFRSDADKERRKLTLRRK